MAHTIINVNEIGTQQMYPNFMDFLQSKLAECNGQDFYKFERNQHDELKKFIAYYFFGHPTAGVYNYSQQSIVDMAYNKLFQNLDKCVDAVEISCVNICIVEELGQNYLTEPCLIVRKCSQPINGGAPCSIVIDIRTNVFPSWKNFLKDNYYKNLAIYAPANGLYRADATGQIILESRQAVQSCLRILFIVDIIVSIVAVALYVTGAVLSIHIQGNNYTSTNQALAIVVFVLAIMATVYLIIRRCILVQCISESRTVKNQQVRNFMDYGYVTEPKERVQCKKCSGFYLALPKHH